MFTSQDSFNTILASNPIFIFDTNIFLELLRLSKGASLELLSLFYSVIEDIRITAQVRKELEKNIPIVSNQRISNLRVARTTIKNALNACSTSISTQLDVFIRLKFPDAQDLRDSTDNELETTKGKICDYIDCILGSADHFIEVAQVTTFIDAVWNDHPQENYKPSKLLSLFQEGFIRYRYKIPPGYMDDPQNNKSSKKDGTDVFGDLLLWNQILDCGSSMQQPIIFVTNDLKEDWFVLGNAHPIMPRDELILEFNEKTNGQEICILTYELFVKYLSANKKIDASTALLEMQIDDYTDATLQKNDLMISKALISWANESDHILQFPFCTDVTTLKKIDNIRYVVKSASLVLKDFIEYSVILEGAADFYGIRTEETTKRYTKELIHSSMQFELRLTFLRHYERNTDGSIKPLKEISNLHVTNAMLEPIPSSNISLESKRGVFIIPTEECEDIYAYMESIWDDYISSSMSDDEAEALVFFDAAEHFNKSLLEIYRAYTLVSYGKSKSNLSLNEIDILALKRFKDINIQIHGTTATYSQKNVPLGDVYPPPDSMKLLPPELGKELAVDFDIDIEFSEKHFIICRGTTNLPPQTLLMIKLHSLDQEYQAESKAFVEKDGTFTSGQFSNSKNPPTNEMLRGNYSISLITPVVSVQPDGVKLVLGKKGRNLSGPFVHEDTIFGKTIHYNEDFVI